MDKLIEFIKSKSFSAAEKLLRKELVLSPNNCYLLTQLANVLWNRCKDKEALSYADKAKEVCPVMPLLNYTRGRILWSLEKYEQSIEEWDVVLNMRRLRKMAMVSDGQSLSSMILDIIRQIVSITFLKIRRPWLSWKSICHTEEKVLKVISPKRKLFFSIKY